MTKFVFKNKEYSKNRLIQAMVIDYLKRHKKITLEQFNSRFGKDVQGKYFLILDIKTAKKLSASYNRYFINEPIVLHDGSKVVVCSQWDKNNIMYAIKALQ